MTKRSIVTIITNILGERVVITRQSLDHAKETHFEFLPEYIVLEFIERILKEPTVLYEESLRDEKKYNFFYKIEKTRFVVVVVKITSDGAFFASMYPTGSSVRPKHKKLKKVKL